MLRPYATSPTICTTKILRQFFGRSPIKNPIITEVLPEKTPFSKTIFNGSLDDNLRVQLFSIPKHKQASKTNSEPKENENDKMSSKDNIKQEIVTNKIPNHRRKLILS